MSPNHDMGELLAGGAPWRFPAICRDCGQEYVALTWSPTKRDYEGPLIRFGACQGCITAEREEFEEQQRWLAEQRRRPDKVVPDLEEAKRKLLEEEIQGDAFDPFSKRRDLF